MNTIEKTDAYIMNTYNRMPAVFVRGQGARLWDDQGKVYHDFLAGIAVCNLGHAHPEVTQAVSRQAARLVHVSNLYYSEPQARVAELLVSSSFTEKVFFCNSGAEANECALKISRLWGKEKLNGAYKVIAMQGSFHGRTMATLAATGQSRIQAGFSPLLPEFIHVPYGDAKALEKALGPEVCAVILEPVLGEGGVVTPPPQYLRQVRDLCDQRNLLMILDEIQTGLGRTGRMFAHEHFAVTPDIMTLAKALAGGLPAGAACAGTKASSLLKPGMHASTFGGGPVVMAAAAAVLETLLAPGFLETVRRKGLLLNNGLTDLIKKYPSRLRQARGLGLMIGLEWADKADAEKIQRAMWDKGFIINRTQGRVLRLVPPLVVEDEQIDRLLLELDASTGEL
ncbi:MAG: acetylornithine transaminase [Desulfarculales bacterium]|jgi:predicted acetylornithine/succinylornithine family transaminase|nr:acetylornithine transaminase [Desulfarculales bacterium]